MIEVLRLVARCPFTVLMACLLIAAGVYGRAHVGPLDSEVHQQAGHSPHLLWRGEWQRVFTSLLFTAGGWRFYSSLVMLVLAVGWVESAISTPIAIVSFVGIHLSTLLLMSLGIALTTSVFESHRGNLLWYVQDVGPSAGYYGCLGLMILSLAPNLRLPLALGIVVLLGLRLAWSAYHLHEGGQHFSADVAHLIAFPLGMFVWRVLP